MTDAIPSYVVPAFNSIGANEYIVDVTHMVPGPDGELVPAVDFMSTVDTPAAWELNIWYHTLNCGFRTRISGETRLPLHLRRPRGHGPLVRQTRRRPRLRRVVRGDQQRAVVCVGRDESSLVVSSG